QPGRGRGLEPASRSRLLGVDRARRRRSGRVRAPARGRRGFRGKPHIAAGLLRRGEGRDRVRRRPKIGVTVSARSGWRVFPFFRRALWRSGGRAVRIQTGRDRLALDGLEGLIIGGGDDLSVELYGGRLVPESTFDRARDELEMTLVAEAEHR